MFSTSMLWLLARHLPVCLFSLWLQIIVLRARKKIPLVFVSFFLFLNNVFITIANGFTVYSRMGSGL